MGKFVRTPYGDLNDNSELIVSRDFKRGDDSIRIRVTENDMYFDRVHKGHYVPKYTQDIHRGFRGKGNISVRSFKNTKWYGVEQGQDSTGHVKDL